MSSPKWKTTIETCLALFALVLPLLAGYVQLAGLGAVGN